MGNSTFTQPIDHKNSKEGTFEQRYWWNAEYYEEGGPVFLFNGGESDASDLVGYVDNYTLPGLFAQEFKGIAIVIEHRYFGESVPYDTLTAETLQYLTLPQSIKDMTNFASTIDLPFCEGNCNTNDNPWVLMGGSYSGALTAWTQQIEPGTFTAYHASSAVVEAIYDFNTYYQAVTDAMPKNCSADVKAVIKYVDGVLCSEDKEDINTLKTRFGLSALNDADFARYITLPQAQWQADQAYVFNFCDAIESVASNYTNYMTDKNEDGVGLVAALDAYSKFVKTEIAPSCGENGAGCSSFSDNIDWNTPKDFADQGRQWDWLLCNEPFGFWQVGPATNDNGTAVIPSALRPDYYQRQCPLKFPKTNGFESGSEMGFTAEHLNMWTGGWNADFDKVNFVQGKYDPWRAATIGADTRPGGPKASTESVPNLVVLDGVHVPELAFVNGMTKYQKPVVTSSIENMRRWLSDWEKPSRK
ncbi:serine carboxypeptidase S28 [Xylariaceae sp. FL1019]|nr:serine carboxypeptidase S28 [Xylariaceae sp. FL1019]